MPKIDEIFIYDTIGFDGVNEKSFKEELDKCTSNEIIIHLNTPGGSVMSGWAIANLIKNERSKGKKFIAVNEGLVASIGTAIMIACDEINCYENSLTMIHLASIGIYANRKELLKEVEILEKIDNQLAEMYSIKSNGKYEKDFYLDLMENETWLLPHEVIDIGLCDNIISDSVSYVACADVSKHNFKDTSKLENLINKIKEKVVEDTTEQEKIELYNWLNNFKI